VSAIVFLFLMFTAHLALGADLIAIDANVITADKAHPSAQAFAIDNGRFTAVGTNDEVLKFRTSSTTIIDLKGRTVVPGFNDAHLHPRAIFAKGSPYYSPWLGPDKVLEGSSRRRSELAELSGASSAWLSSRTYVFNPCEDR
jgi:imidazolonepropionase-like amidohydrolase